MRELRGLIPARYILESIPIKYDEVVVLNWLEQEVDMQAEKKLPGLKAIKGHRRREVVWFIKSTNAFWDVKVSQMYA